MKIEACITDRAPLIAALSAELGLPAVYGGPPGFQYRVGVYTVLRDGSLLVEPDRADGALLARLAHQGLVRAPVPQAGPVCLPLAGLGGPALCNLVRTVSARGALLSKSIGRPGAFSASPLLVQRLWQAQPATQQAFAALVQGCGPGAWVGVQLAAGELCFSGFPRQAPAAQQQAYRQLAERMLAHAATHRWVKARAEQPANEQYAFRTWLNAIGMLGPQYRQARQLLLAGLAGDPVYRTPAQRQAAQAKRQRPAPAPLDFVLL